MSQNRCPQDPSCRAPKKPSPALVVGHGQNRGVPIRWPPTRKNADSLCYTSPGRRFEELRLQQKLNTFSPSTQKLLNNQWLPFHANPFSIPKKPSEKCVCFFSLPNCTVTVFFCPSLGGDLLLVATTDSPTPAGNCLISPALRKARWSRWFSVFFGRLVGYIMFSRFLEGSALNMNH